ncbi:uncharacterized protein LOC111022403 [Momordica charantia]|uniref:Uncharacterized protein LOC111022403 n=1 Tax=Momordica charantia TaxID=3673 RepID=A0A6J1DNV9_MOMCH|nr:uncharacterized protein LOC111022403 [Momordica charantia]
MLDKASDEDLDVLLIGSWVIWNHRNYVIFRGEHSSFSTMIQQLTKFVTESSYQSETSLSMLHKTLNNKLKWEPPPMHIWTLNADASWSDSTHRGGIGWIIRSWDGDIVLAGNRFVEACNNVKLLEASAILEGLRNLTNLGVLRPLHIETDSAEVESLLNRKREDLTKTGWVVEEILNLRDSCEILAFAKVGRETNGCAHSLAQRASVLRESMIWVDCFPNWLSILAKSRPFIID